jgi:2-amino-4-hydroxy-6-hydroxymethyldihydropteridine diphosphokinase
MTDVFIGIGSNIHAETHLDSAVWGLKALFGELALSRVYRNPAVGFAGEDFLNLVARARTIRPPGEVQRELRALELRAGRDRALTGLGPRTLDLDLLLYGTMVDAGRRLPREDVLRHAFVLCPLLDLAPDLIHPVTGEAIALTWHACTGVPPAWVHEGCCWSDLRAPASAAVVPTPP